MRGCRVVTLDATPRAESSRGGSRFDRGDRAAGDTVWPLRPRRIRRLLVDEGRQVSVKRIYRIWRREGLKVPKKQPKRGRLWLNGQVGRRLLARS
jgi:hypothetical protein